MSAYAHTHAHAHTHTFLTCWEMGAASFRKQARGQKSGEAVGASEWAP